MFRVDAQSGTLSIVADDFDKPNGIAFSPDESRLFIADSGKPRHMRVFDVKDEKGVVTNWNFELASPNVLRRNGWTRTSLNVGDEVTVEGALAKNGSKMANARVVKLADGRKVFAGSSGGDAPPPSAEAK